MWGALLLTAFLMASLGPSLGSPKPEDNIAETLQAGDPLANNPELRVLLGGTLPHKLRRLAASRTPRALRGRKSFKTIKGDSCRWTMNGSPKSRASLSVKCKAPDGGRVECEYRGKPSACKAFAKRSSKYWTQVVKVLKRKKDPCGGHATIEPHVCRKGPKDAFLTKNRTKVTKPPQTKNRKTDKKSKSGELSEQFCSETWNAFCSFFVNFFYG